MQRLLRKQETAKGILPKPLRINAGKPTRFGVIYYGSTAPAMSEAAEILTERGHTLDLMRVRAFPFHQDVASFISDHDDKLAALEKAGHPVARIVLKSADHIGQEFFRFEMATAVAGAVLGINPFNQPDVEAAKVKTRELTSAFEKSGKLPDEKPVISNSDVAIYTDSENSQALRKAGANGDLRSCRMTA